VDEYKSTLEQAISRPKGVLKV